MKKTGKLLYFKFSQTFGWIETDKYQITRKSKYWKILEILTLSGNIFDYAGAKFLWLIYIIYIVNPYDQIQPPDLVPCVGFHLSEIKTGRGMEIFVLRSNGGNIVAVTPYSVAILLEMTKNNFQCSHLWDVNESLRTEEILQVTNGLMCDVTMSQTSHHRD